MSISGSGEVKTAIAEVNPAGGNTRTAAIDAQEDREIVGVSITNRLTAGGPDPTAGLARVFIGTNPLAEPGGGADSIQDNRSWFEEHHSLAQDDDVNGDGGMNDSSKSVWYGHGSGVEWNEDSTLSVTVLSTNAAVFTEVVVYYREL